jgi:hypothetical protein
MRNPPILYERRRPPVPPSMRRNHQRSNSAEDGSTPYGSNLEMSRSAPHINGFPNQSPEGPSPPSATNWLISEYATQGTGRSNTMSGELPRQPGPIFNPDRNRRVRRSMSLSGMPGTGMAGFPAIPEVPSGQSSPMTQNPPKLMTTNLAEGWEPMMTPGVGPGPPQIQWDRRHTPDTPKLLTIRNPSPPTPNPPTPTHITPKPATPAHPAAAEEKSGTISSLVKRVGSLRQPETSPGFKVQDAARNF